MIQLLVSFLQLLDKAFKLGVLLLKLVDVLDQSLNFLLIARYVVSVPVGRYPELLLQHFNLSFVEISLPLEIIGLHLEHIVFDLSLIGQLHFVILFGGHSII